MIVGGWWIREKIMTKFSPKPSVTSKPDYTALGQNKLDRRRGKASSRDFLVITVKF